MCYRGSRNQRYRSSTMSFLQRAGTFLVDIRWELMTLTHRWSLVDKGTLPAAI